MNSDTNKISVPSFSQIRARLKNYTMIFALLLIWIVFGFLNQNFFSARNLSNLFRQMSIIGFLAIGMVPIIVTGNIDLSVGSVTGFVSALAAYFQVYVFADMFPALLPGASPATILLFSALSTIILSLLVGYLIGCLHGYIVAYLGIPAFIVTLAGMIVFRGGVLGVTGGENVGPVNDAFKFVAQGYIPIPIGYILAIIAVALIVYQQIRRQMNRQRFGLERDSIQRILFVSLGSSLLILLYTWTMSQYRGIQNPVLILFIVATLMTYVSNNTRLGRYSYAIGGNREAAQLSGINTKKTIFYIFSLMGLMSGIAGVILAGYVGSATPLAGNQYELDTIAACVLGGTSLMGGEGTILGTLVGALITASLINGMSLMNLDIFWQYMAKGIVLVVAVYIDVLSKRGAKS